MLCLLVYLVVTIGAALFSVTLLYYTYPGILVKLYLRVTLYRAGFRIKYVEETGFKFCYAERGKRSRNSPSLLLIHGFTASKDGLISLCRKFPPDIHIIVIDLPGHGETSVPLTDDDVSVEGFVSRIEQFVKLVGLDEQPFHILGQSLGGQITAIFTAKNPQLVERATLICPAMASPVQSVFERKMRAIMEDNSDTAHCPLIPKTIEELKEMMDLVLHRLKPPSKLIMKGILDLRKPFNTFYLRMFKTFLDDRYGKLVENYAHKIQVPVQVIWGRNDRVVDVSAVETLKRIVPDLQQIHIFDNCGHSVNFEAPGELVKAVLNFRDNFTQETR